MAPISFSGSLAPKRKEELLEIAQQLDIAGLDDKSKKADLIKTIQSHLDEKAPELRDSPEYRGLYGRRRHHSDDESPVSIAIPDAKAVIATATSVVKQGRKSINKVIEKTIDAANIPLPESPLADRVAKVANDGLEVALAPTQHLPVELQSRLKTASSAVVPYIRRGPERVERVVRVIQRHLSQPENLITTALAIELAFLLSQTLQFYEHTLFFPPVGGAKGDFYSLLHSVFGWAPVTALTIKLPEYRSLFGGQMWSALTWWFFTTVLPPLAMSTLVSFVPQKALPRSGVITRHHASQPHHHGSQLPHPSPDPLAFTLFRLAALILPLTTAAPAAYVDALELSGNSQGRALGAALVALLTGADRLRA